MSFDRVRRVLEQEFPGRRLQDLFAEFDEEPVASASIAQVHRARLHAGDWVAVKVQKDYIQRQLNWDLRVFRLVLWSFERLFQLPLSWSADYTEHHLRQEVDFLNEARNAERAADDLAHDRRLAQSTHVPAIHWPLTTRRVLTAEWVDGCSLAHPDSVLSLGFSSEDIMAICVDLFSHQLFISGFVHADPHPGNILVRRHPFTGEPQLCLLDHGLYCQESEAFRLQYCEFWRALFVMDEERKKAICRSWGIEDVGIFATATLQRPYHPTKAVHLGPQTIRMEDVYQMQMVTKERIQRFLSDTSKVPPELIFVGRNLNLVRSNNKMYGSPVNRVYRMALYAIQGIGSDAYAVMPSGAFQQFSRNPARRSQTLVEWAKRSWRAQWNLTLFKLRLTWLSVAFYITRWMQSVRRWLGMEEVGFEDVLDRRLLRTLREQFGVDISPKTFDS